MSQLANIATTLLIFGLSLGCEMADDFDQELEDEEIGVAFARSQEAPASLTSDSKAAETPAAIKTSPDGNTHRGKIRISTDDDGNPNGVSVETCCSTYEYTSVNLSSAAQEDLEELLESEGEGPFDGSLNTNTDGRIVRWVKAD